MKKNNPPLLNLTKEILSALNSRNVLYALSGALANIAWGVPRSTFDIDILVSVPQIQLPSLLEIFFSFGFKGDLKELISKARKEHFIRLEHSVFALEIFLPAIPYHHQVLKRRVRQEFESIPAWFVSLEDLIILKLLFHRSKDIGDIKGILATHSTKIDKGYIMKTLPILVSKDDSRLKEIEELLTRYTAPPHSPTEP